MRHTPRGEVESGGTQGEGRDGQRGHDGGPDLPWQPTLGTSSVGLFVELITCNCVFVCVCGCFLCTYIKLLSATDKSKVYFLIGTLNCYIFTFPCT